MVEPNQIYKTFTLQYMIIHDYDFREMLRSIDPSLDNDDNMYTDDMLPVSLQTLVEQFFSNSLYDELVLLVNLIIVLQSI